MASNDSRIKKLRTYLFNILDEMLNSTEYSINANFLDNEIENYSLDKIPVEPVTEQWITGEQIRRDVYNFRSRKTYSQDVLNNLTNVGFFETFEDRIRENNENRILPEDAESIICLNCGTLNVADTNEVEFDVQIQVEWRQ